MKMQENKPVDEILEQELRPMLINSLRHGRLLVVRMTNSAVDFKTQVWLSVSEWYRSSIMDVDTWRFM